MHYLSSTLPLLGPHTLTSTPTPFWTCFCPRSVHRGECYSCTLKAATAGRTTAGFVPPMSLRKRHIVSMFLRTLQLSEGAKRVKGSRSKFVVTLSTNDSPGFDSTLILPPVCIFCFGYIRRSHSSSIIAGDTPLETLGSFPQEYKRPLPDTISHTSSAFTSPSHSYIQPNTYLLLLLHNTTRLLHHNVECHHSQIRHHVTSKAQHHT